MLASEPYDAVAVVWNPWRGGCDQWVADLAAAVCCVNWQVYALQSVLVLGVNLGLSYVAPAHVQ